jgi:N-6 DNA methylase
MPADYFGDVMCELKGRRNRTGFYPTPHSVCEMMARMTFFDAGRDGAVDLRKATVCDPCVGTGRMLLHAANYSLRLYGQDIDPRVVQACLINGALYAPWIAWPFDENIFERDAPLARQLTDEEVMGQRERHAAERGALDRSKGAAKADRKTEAAMKVEGRKFPSDLVVESKSIEGSGPAQSPPMIVLPSEVRYSESAEAVYTAIEQNLLFENLGFDPKKGAGETTEVRVRTPT